MGTRNSFAHNVADLIGAQHCDRNAWAWMAWMQAEGGSAANNPLNCIVDRPGATLYNHVPGVKNYPTWEVGVEATAWTLKQQNASLGFIAIVKCMKRCAPAHRTLEAVIASDWGTTDLALRCLPEVRANYPHYGSMPVAEF